MAKYSGENFQTRIYAPSHHDYFRNCNKTNNLEEEKLYLCSKIIRFKANFKCSSLKILIVLLHFRP